MFRLGNIWHHSAECQGTLSQMRWSSCMQKLVLRRRKMTTGFWQWCPEAGNPRFESQTSMTHKHIDENCILSPCFWTFRNCPSHLRISFAKNLRPSKNCTEQVCHNSTFPADLARWLWRWRARGSASPQAWKTWQGRCAFSSSRAHVDKPPGAWQRSGTMIWFLWEKIMEVENPLDLRIRIYWLCNFLEAMMVPIALWEWLWKLISLSPISEAYFKIISNDIGKWRIP